MIPAHRQRAHGPIIKLTVEDSISAIVCSKLNRLRKGTSPMSAAFTRAFGTIFCVDGRVRSAQSFAPRADRSARRCDL